MKPTACWFVAVVLALSFPFAAHALNKKLGPKSYEDARQCLELPTNEAIIRCAERFM
jgi:hypothetical protein